MTLMRTKKSSQCNYVNGGFGGAGASHGVVQSVLIAMTPERSLLPLVGFSEMITLCDLADLR